MYVYVYMSIYKLLLMCLYCVCAFCVGYGPVQGKQ